MITLNTIAVLPFVNMSSDPENEFFADGITEEIINALASIQSLQVTSRTSSFYFKNKQVPLREIASQLKVSVILEGSVRVAGNSVRITAQLVQASDDFHFWSVKWDRKLDNLFEIQDEISLLIAEKLREQFGHFELQDHLVKKQTNNLDAYALSLKGNFYFNKWNPKDVEQAITFYEKAIQLDPNHTDSYVGLADAYGFMATTSFMPREEAWEKAIAYTEKAFALDPQHAGVHYQLANIAFFTSCDFKLAAEHAFQSVKLKPNYPEAQQYTAFLFMLSGKYEKAEHHLKLALAIDPLNQETLFYKAYFAYRCGEFKSAIEQFKQLLDTNPKNIPAITVLLYCYLMEGEFGQLHKTLDTLPDELIIPDERLGITCLALIREGNYAELESHLSSLETAAQRPDAFQAHSYLFLAYANLNRNHDAFAWLEQALAMKSSIFLLSYSDPLIGSLSNDERYVQYHRKLYPDLALPASDAESKMQRLDSHTAKEYTTKLLEFVKHEEPYLNPDISLRSLADSVEIHPNQLSWLLNEVVGKNFNEFINGYRVEHFKKLAGDPANSHISLLGLAYESGFNSKTVFNTFFKKEVGSTPSEYLKNTSLKTKS